MRNTNITRRAFLGTAGLLAATLAACGGGGSTSDGGGSTDAAAGSVYWLNFKPELDETLQSLAATYTEKTGVSVKVVTAASGTYEQTLISAMDKTDEAPTLFVIGNAGSVDEWGSYALDLTGTPIEAESNTDAYNQYDSEGKLVSQGYCYECYGIVTNVDLVEKAGHTMAEITNFDGLKAVVEDIHTRAAELGFDAFAAPDMDGDNSWRITGHLANLEYYYEEQAAGAKWETCPESITGAYMDNYKNILDLIINNAAEDPATLATGGHAPMDEFTGGKAAFFLTGSWDHASIAEAQPNTTMIPYYCGVEGEEKAGLNCGTENCWAVNAKMPEEDQQATLDFMVWLVSDPEASGALSAQLGTLPFANATPGENAYLQAANDYTAAGNYVMDWATNFQPNVDAYRAALVSALNVYCADQSDANWAQVVTAFVDGWATQYAEVNA